MMTVSSPKRTYTQHGVNILFTQFDAVTNYLLDGRTTQGLGGGAAVYI